MTLHLNSQDDLEEAIHALVKRDPRLKPVFELTGMPALRRREAGFAGLAAIICWSGHGRARCVVRCSAACRQNSPPRRLKRIAPRAAAPPTAASLARGRPPVFGERDPT